MRLLRIRPGPVRAYTHPVASQEKPAATHKYHEALRRIRMEGKKP